MSGTGRCYDNARMESFFATLKKQKLYKIHTERYPMADMKSIIFKYIDRVLLPEAKFIFNEKAIMSGRF